MDSQTTNHIILLQVMHVVCIVGHLIQSRCIFSELYCIILGYGLKQYNWELVIIKVGWVYNSTIQE